MQLFELKRHVSRRLALGRRLGSASPTEEIRISVLLHPKDDQALAAAAERVCNPKSPGYGRFLSRDEIRSLVAPGYQDYDTVVAWLNDKGLTTEDPAGIRTVIHARGSAEAIEQALSAPIGRYAFPGRRSSHYAIEQNPSIPAALAPLVRGIAGLNDLPAARLFPPLLAPSRSKVPRRGADDARGPAGGYTPQTIRRAYGVPEKDAISADGAGQRVGIVQFGGGFSPADFAAFCAQFDLPGGDVREVSVSGAKNDYRGKTGDADLEVAMDMDWVRAIAPRAEIDVIFVPNVDRGWVDLLATLLDLPDGARPDVVSISWGMPEDGFSTSRRYDQTRQLFLCSTLLGMSFVSASGDAGASDETPGSPSFDGQRHVDFPSVIPEVTSAGGTKLRSSPGGFTETVWNDGAEGGATGGGFSRFVRIPSWQKDYLGKRTPVPTGRGIPDVAAVASPDPGLAIHCRKSWTAAGGTSVAAPIWAGFLAHVNAARAARGRPRLGAANPALYAAHGAKRKSPFRDVTDGDNSFANVEGFPAGKGWDPATGLGSVDLAALIEAL